MPTVILNIFSLKINKLFLTFLDANSSQPRSEVDSISNIIFKGVFSPAGSVNLTYISYLVNQSQVEMNIPINSQKREELFVPALDILFECSGFSV